jgi:hypothetical protein
MKAPWPHRDVLLLKDCILDKLESVVIETPGAVWRRGGDGADGLRLAKSTIWRIKYHPVKGRELEDAQRSGPWC